MKKKLSTRSFAFLIMLLVLGACKQTPEPTAQKNGLKLPYGILPSGVTIDGGWFSTLSGSYEGFPADTVHTLTAEVGLAYHDWPGAITVDLGGSPLTDYITSVTSLSGSPYNSHTWVVDSNLADSVPNINHTIRSISPLDIALPLMWDSITSSGFTVTWTPTLDSTTGAVIMLIPTPNPLDSTAVDSIPSTIVSVPDNGSYSISSTMLSGIPSGFRVYVYIIRYALDIASIGGHNYAFLNGFQRGGIYIMH